MFDQLQRDDLQIELQDPEESQPQSLCKKFTIVGAGAVGVSTALMLRKEFLKAQKKQITNGLVPTRCTITLVDPRDYAGAGLTYWDQEFGTDSKVHLNNQPNERMIIDPEYPDAYAIYLAEKDGASDPAPYRTKFSTRAEFGAFVNYTLSKAIESSADSNVIIEYRKAVVGNVTPADTGKIHVHITKDNGALTEEPAENDAVILAVGHSRNNLFAEVNEHAGFFESPANIGALHKHLEQQDQKGLSTDVAIIGGGQSMIDALAAIDRNGQGWNTPERKIHILTMAQPLHWPFIPDENPVELDEYPFTPVFLNLEYLETNSISSLEQLKALLEQEVESAAKKPITIGEKSLYFGRGHVYAKLDLESLSPHFQTAEQSKIFAEFRNYVSTLYSSPTPPERHTMLTTYLENSASVHLGRIGPDNIHAEDGNFIISTQNETLTVGTIINAACFARTAFSDANDPSSTYNPLLRRLNMAGHLKPSDTIQNHFAVGAQNTQGIYIARSAVTHNRWGMESFSRGNKNLAENIAIEYILSHG